MLLECGIVTYVIIFYNVLLSPRKTQFTGDEHALWQWQDLTHLMTRASLDYIKTPREATDLYHPS